MGNLTVHIPVYFVNFKLHLKERKKKHDFFLFIYFFFGGGGGGGGTVGFSTEHKRSLLAVL